MAPFWVTNFHKHLARQNSWMVDQVFMLLDFCLCNLLPLQYRIYLSCYKLKFHWRFFPQFDISNFNYIISKLNLHTVFEYSPSNSLVPASVVQNNMEDNMGLSDECQVHLVGPWKRSFLIFCKLYFKNLQLTKIFKKKCFNHSICKILWLKFSSCFWTNTNKI